MKSNKEYRFKNNPKEKEFHDKFKEMFDVSSTTLNSLSALIFGWENDRQSYPKEYLTEKGRRYLLKLNSMARKPCRAGIFK